MSPLLQLALHLVPACSPPSDPELADPEPAHSNVPPTLPDTDIGFSTAPSKSKQARKALKDSSKIVRRRAAKVTCMIIMLRAVNANWYAELQMIFGAHPLCLYVLYAVCLVCPFELCHTTTACCQKSIASNFAASNALGMLRRMCHFQELYHTYEYTVLC